MDLAGLVPWAVVVSLLGLAAKLFVENRKLRLAEANGARDQQRADQELREAGQRLLLEAADRLSNAPEHIHDRAECIGVLIDVLVQRQWAPYAIAERRAVEFVRRMGFGSALEGVEFGFEIESGEPE